MRKPLQKIFSQATHEPEQELSSVIWRGICKQEKAEKSRIVWGYSIAGIASLSGLVFIIKDILNSFTQSGFYDYMSLVSSDGGALTKYWKEFTFSITESLPTTSIMLSFLLLFIIFISLRRVVYQHKNQLLTA